jgi:hypothetical protein
MSFDQTGVQACLAPWVTRPLPAKKSTKVGREVFMSSFEQVSGVVSNLECLRKEWVEISKIQEWNRPALFSNSCYLGPNPQRLEGVSKD